jgi:CheY-like chemotaxis protein
MMSFWGIRVQAFKSVSQAITSLPEVNYDLAILGYKLPEEDQNKLIDVIHMRGKSDEIPLLLITATGDSHTRAELVVGFTGFLQIPIKPARVFEQLQAVLGQPTLVSKVEGDSNWVSKDSNISILLAEDDLTNQTALKYQLKRIGFEADIATTGLEVISAMEEYPYNVVMMDLQMPDMDGLSATRYIRESFPPGKQPFIIALTADTREEARNMVYESGADLYLPKPIRGNILTEALNQAQQYLEGYQSKEEAGVTEPSLNFETLDENILEDFISTMGDYAEEALATLLDSFLENTPKLVSNMQTAADEGEWEDLRWSAHALKGNCELLGASRLASMCKNIEDDIRADHVGNMTNCVQEVAAEFNQVTLLLDNKRKEI